MITHQSQPLLAAHRYTDTHIRTQLNGFYTCLTADWRQWTQYDIDNYIMYRTEDGGVWGTWWVGDGRKRKEQNRTLNRRPQNSPPSRPASGFLNAQHSTCVCVFLYVVLLCVTVSILVVVVVVGKVEWWCKCVPAHSFVWCAIRAACPPAVRCVCVCVRSVLVWMVGPHPNNRFFLYILKTV